MGDGGGSCAGSGVQLTCEVKRDGRPVIRADWGLRSIKVSQNSGVTKVTIRDCVMQCAVAKVVGDFVEDYRCRGKKRGKKGDGEEEFW